ncbi:hypothetical protein GCM10023208_00620 [Erythrobacter westpacificensis]|uniref:Uncharacterized protein n=1 Tax=Erythrobacter westpacificensis TaxID=1055231 RepID=A0ABP9JVL9_9SPHN
MSRAVDQEFDQFIRNLKVSREMTERQERFFTQEYEAEKQRASRGAALRRLKDVKEFWGLMMLLLPRPVTRPVIAKEFSWLYDIDWHFDSFESGLREHSKRVPAAVLEKLFAGSAKARELFHQDSSEAAQELMAEIWNTSWTRKADLQRLSELLND